MATLEAADVADLLIAAQKDLGRGKLTDISTDYQEMIALSNLMVKGRAVIESGTSIKWNVMRSTGNNFRTSGLFSVDNLNQADLMTTADVPWRHTETGFVYDVRERLMASGRAQVLDFYKLQRYGMLGGQAEGMEEIFWEEPSSSTDKETPYGIKYWLVYNVTEGFYGGNNTNWSSGPAGVNRTTYPRWNNYTFNYTNVTRTDFIRKAKKARWSCAFRPSIPNAPIPQYSGPGLPRYGQYTTYDLYSELEEAAEDQNDQLGRDLASMAGRVMLGRVPVTAVSYLQQNEATADPFVGIDWKVFKAVFERGRYMLEDKPHVKAGQHNVVEGFMDNSFNFVCYDPRKCFLGAKSTWH